MDLNTMKVGIFGLGHIGLPTAAILANNHINVIGIDVNPKVVDMINNEASVQFKEPHLDELLKKAIQSNYLHATTNKIKASQECNVFIVIVPTPTYDDKTADLSYVISACESIKDGLKKDDLVIIESTVPPQTGVNVIKPILEKSGLKCGEDFMLAYSPERALPNNTIHEMTHNVRIIGGYDKKSADMTEKLYKNITQGEIIKVKNITSAEMIKLMENTYRDVNIALANEFALICENINVDVNEVITAANYHPRVNIHTPGPGVGGHCIPVDPYFLVELENEYDIDAKLISEARRINNSMPQHVIDILLDNIEDKTSDYTVSILGIAYKGNVDDIRESPSIKLIKLLKQLNLKVLVNDPYVSCDMIKSFDVECVSLDEALKSDCVILMTDHHEYINITPDMIENKFIIATRPILDADEFRKAKINYQAIGNLDN